MQRFVAVLLLIAAAFPVAAQHRSVSADVADLVREEFDGESAFETVAYLDQFVRWPGNRGFEASIDHVAKRLQTFGFVRESDADADDRLTYRIESYPMEQPAWEPLDASIRIDGDPLSILSFDSNRNMLARMSYSTPEAGVVAELIDVGMGSPAELDATEVSGKIVLADGNLSALLQSAVVERGAVGVLVYDMPAYLQPEKNRQSIQFRGIDSDVAAHSSWGISLSYEAREKLHAALSKGPVRINVRTKVRWTQNATERTVVADVRGSLSANERFVFSAHVQEPGANDNASGVGAQVEMARVAASLVSAGKVDPKRTITFLWGDEIVSTRRYVSQDEARAKGIRWGLSLDMVGQDTSKTGGTFLIEKMPDPSAIWTRGEDQHSEWGGEPLTKADMMPHYFNDLVLGRALEQAATNNWIVKTNPFEGGSDHVPFLQAGIPGLLFWHFTDQFYHTDRDRLEMVSSDELKNSGVTALVTGLTMASADGHTARGLIEEITQAAMARLDVEANLGTKAVAEGGSISEEKEILETWADWYDQALSAMQDIEVGGSSPDTVTKIQDARRIVKDELANIVNSM